jgi:hypothetical protein
MVAEFVRIQRLVIRAEFLRIQLQFAFLIFTLAAIRTGRRNGEHSAKGPPLEAATHTPRHEPARFDLTPGSELAAIIIDGEMKVALANKLIVDVFL